MRRQELFIYWRCDPADEAGALKAAAQMQSTLLAHHPGLQARLYRRRGDAASDGTVMESYAVNAECFDPALMAVIDAMALTALTRWCRGPRHAEWFEYVPADPG